MALHTKTITTFFDSEIVAGCVVLMLEAHFVLPSSSWNYNRYLYFFEKFPCQILTRGEYDLGKKVLMELEFTAYLLQPIFLPNNILTSTRPAYFNCQIHLFHSIKTIGFIQWGLPFLSRFKCFKLLMNQLYGSKRIKCLFVQGTTKY